MLQKLWINKNHKQRIQVRGIDVLPNIEKAKILDFFYDRKQEIKIMIVDIEKQLFLFSLMWDGEFEQGELIPIHSKDFGLSMIKEFKGFLYGSTTD
jgi:hypothetical protein